MGGLGLIPFGHNSKSMKTSSLLFYLIYIVDSVPSTGQIGVTKYIQVKKKYAMANEGCGTIFISYEGILLQLPA